MKTTGVIRRIDDLGRIVIPKEIRRNLRIHDGESMEIFVDKDFITLKKYSSLDELTNISKLLVDSINNETKKTVFITDMDRVIAFAGDDKKRYLSLSISNYLAQIINERKRVKIVKKKIELIDGIDEDISCIIYPIIANGDASGAVVIISKNNDISESEDQLVKIISEFLGKHIEE